MVVIDIPYTLPQEELVMLFSRNYNKQIYSILQIERNITFENTLAQVNIIEEAKI